MLFRCQGRAGKHCNYLVVAFSHSCTWAPAIRRSTHEYDWETPRSSDFCGRVSRSAVSPASCRMEGDTVTCHETGTHALMFHWISGESLICRSLVLCYLPTDGCHFIALAREGSKYTRPSSETGSINLTAYHPSLAQEGLPPPEKPTEQLRSPVSTDYPLQKLCTR